MDISKEYEKYKKDWCAKHNRPMFKESQIKIKMACWKDFTEEFLVPNYKQINADYKNMTAKTVGDWKKELEEAESEEVEEIEEEIEDIVEEHPEEDSWELVKKIMDNL